MSAKVQIPASELFRQIRIKKDKLLEDRYSVYYMGKLAGYIVNKKDCKYYITRRKFEEHYFRIYDGYGISAPILAILRVNKIDKVIIIEEIANGERLLLSNLKDWFEKGFNYTFEFPDGTKDPQRVLPIYEMVVKD